MGRAVDAVTWALAFVACIPSTLCTPTPRGAGRTTQPHIVFALVDDLGYFDDAFQGNIEHEYVTNHVHSMAREGIILKHHYVFYWCSPTRRSFLTGRLPVHHGMQLSDATDDVDLRWSLISDKLKSVGYFTAWCGKGHIGFKSMAHLPTNRGFDHFTGFLYGQQSYYSKDRWQGLSPRINTTYSTELYGSTAVNLVEQHDATTPLFLYVAWQAVHDVYGTYPTDIPGWDEKFPGKANYRGMLWKLNQYMQSLRDILTRKGMWTDTLLIYSADNGGHNDGNNYPLRGEKRTNWEGGIRAAAFVSGGLIPKRLHGTTNAINFHIADWYTTLCNLAGADPTDDSPVPPQPIDPSNPSKVIYPDGSWPGVDGVDIWDMLMNPDKYGRSSAHASLVVTPEVIIRGSLKLVTSSRGNTGQSCNPWESDWQRPDGSWQVKEGYKQTCGFAVYETPQLLCFRQQAHMVPCLIDLDHDEAEEHDLSVSKHETLLDMWNELNTTYLGAYHARSPASLMGPCNVLCADLHWRVKYGYNGVTKPHCGVPTCDAAETSVTREG